MMTTTHLKMKKLPAPDMLCISNMTCTVENIQHNKYMTATNHQRINDGMFLDSNVTHTLNTKKKQIYHLHPHAKHVTHQKTPPLSM